MRGLLRSLGLFGTWSCHAACTLPSSSEDSPFILASTYSGTINVAALNAAGEEIPLSASCGPLRDPCPSISVALARVGEEFAKLPPPDALVACFQVILASGSYSLFEEVAFPVAPIHVLSSPVGGGAVIQVFPGTTGSRAFSMAGVRGGAVLEGMVFEQNRTLTAPSPNNSTEPPPELLLPSRAGALLVENSAGILLKDVTFLGFAIQTSNGHGNAGGAIAIIDSTSSLNNCSFFGNVGVAGGAVYISGGTNVIADSLFRGNEARSIGGGIVPEGASVNRISRCLFEANTATSGGAIDDGGTSLNSVNDCIFTGNNAIYGGAYFAFGSSTSEFSRCSFALNRASNSGGAIYSQSVFGMSFFDSQFSNNEAPDCGVFRMNVGPLRLERCFVENNKALASKGVFGISGGVEHVFSRVVFRGNSATEISIGIVSGRSNTTFDNCTFEANHADGTGGITIDGNNDLTADELNFGFVFLSNSIFTNNVALRGGAAVHCASGLTFTTRVRVIITSTAFVGNKGRQGGAMLASGQCRVRLIGVFAHNNVASSSGGFAYLTQQSSFSMLASSVSLNRALLSGGAFYVEGSLDRDPARAAADAAFNIGFGGPHRLQAKECAFVGNRAKLGGFMLLTAETSSVAAVAPEGGEAGTDPCTQQQQQQQGEQGVGGLEAGMMEGVVFANNAALAAGGVAYYEAETGRLVGAAGRQDGVSSLCGGSGNRLCASGLDREQNKAIDGLTAALLTRASPADTMLRGPAALSALLQGASSPSPSFSPSSFPPPPTSSSSQCTFYGNVSPYGRQFASEGIAALQFLPSAFPSSSFSSVDSSFALSQCLQLLQEEEASSTGFREAIVTLADTQSPSNSSSSSAGGGRVLVEGEPGSTVRVQAAVVDNFGALQTYTPRFLQTLAVVMQEQGDRVTEKGGEGRGFPAGNVAALQGSLEADVSEGRATFSNLIALGQPGRYTLRLLLAPEWLLLELPPPESLLEYVRGQPWVVAAGDAENDAGAAAAVVDSLSNRQLAALAPDRSALDLSLVLSPCGEDSIVDRTAVVYKCVPNPKGRTVLLPSSVFFPLYWALAAVLIACNLFLHWVIYRHRLHPYVKAASHFFTQLIILGSSFGYALLPLFGEAATETSVCVSRPGLASWAFSLLFGAAEAKNRRIHSIYNEKDLGKLQMKMYSKTFSDRKMFRRIALMLLYDAFILVCWTAFDPYSPELLPTAAAGARTVRWDCRSDNMLLWGGLFLAPKLILLVYGSVIAFKVRNVESKYNETKEIGYAIWNFTAFIFITAVLDPLVSDSADAEAALYGLLLVFGVGGSCASFVLPKVLAIASPLPTKPNNTFGTRSASTRAGGGNRSHSQSRTPAASSNRPVSKATGLPKGHNKNQSVATPGATPSASDSYTGLRGVQSDLGGLDAENSSDNFIRKAVRRFRSLTRPGDYSAVLEDSAAAVAGNQSRKNTIELSAV